MEKQTATSPIGRRMRRPMALGSVKGWKKLSVVLLAALFAAAAVAHFATPAPYVRIVPNWVPFPGAVVLGSGVLEAALAVFLLHPRTRRWAAIAAAIFLVLVFPANIQMAHDWWQSHHPHRWIGVLRLPMQPLLVWWAWTVRKP